METTPSDSDWWKTRIKERAMSRRARYLPSNGKIVVVFLTITTFLLTLVAASQRFSTIISVISVALVWLLGLLGLSVLDLSSILDDPYHTRYYRETLAIIDDEIARHEAELKQVANEHLEQFTDSSNRSTAEDALETCSQQLAKTYGSLTDNNS